MDQKYIYKNFDGSYKIQPKFVYFPKSLADILDIIKNNKNKLKIRVSGGNHVFNNISLSEDIIIRTEYLKNITKIKNNMVTVESGIRLKKLVKKLYENNLALHILPVNLYMSLAGAISTGSHGSLFNRGSLADAIIKITLITSNGKILKIKKSDPIFPAISVSLGTMGIIYSLKLLVEPIYYIHQKILKTNWSDIQPNLIDILENNNYSQLEIDPIRTTCNIFLRQKSEIIPKKFNNQNNIYFHIISEPFESIPYTEMEITINFNNLKPAMEDIFSLFQQDEFHYEDLLLIRFIGINKYSYIAESSDYLYNTSISMFTDPKNMGINLFKKFHELLVNKYLGRPHYGKKNFLDYGQMAKIYPNLNKFLDIRNKLDPDNIFTNKYINRLFNLV